MRSKPGIAIALAVVLLAGFGSAATTRPPVPGSVLATAPSPSSKFDQCPFGPSRSKAIPPASLAGVMQDHVPHWLPGGMGLVDSFGSGWGSIGGAYFADARCREIEVFLWMSTDGPSSGTALGPWKITADEPGGCGNAVLGSGRCLDYRVKVEGGVVGVQMMGLDRSEGDRVVLSIPV